MGYIFEKREAVFIGLNDRGFESVVEEVAFSVVRFVVKECESPEDGVHNFGDRDVRVIRGLDDEVEVRVHKAEGEEFEIEFGFVMGDDISEELEVGGRG